MLARRVGVQYIDDIEDAVQSALMTALDAWTTAPPPGNSSAWLYRVAFNKLIGELRQRTIRRRFQERNGKEDIGDATGGSEVFLSEEVQDDLLRMLFICCDEAIPLESQLVLALKTLCGFSVQEIAIRLFTSEANVYKRLGRARRRLREQYLLRRSSVNKVLYLLFTEGYLSSRAGRAIREELYHEAIRLGRILGEHPAGQNAETYALLALM